MVARTLDSTNSGVVWDKFHIYQGHRRNTAFIGIGRRHRPRRLKVDKHPNALKQALHYRELLESGQADSQGELSRLCGTPRTTISAYLRLLGLDEEVRAEALNLSDEDERVARLTEPRLRHLGGPPGAGRATEAVPGPPGRHGAPRGLKEGQMTAPTPVLRIWQKRPGSQVLRVSGRVPAGRWRVVRDHRAGPVRCP